MKLNRLVPAAALVFAACGGSTADKFQANAPTFDKLAISQNDADSAIPAADSADPITENATATTCHPHLFVRTGEIIGRVNRHFFKLLRHVDDLIEDHPKVAAGETRTWENVRNGMDRKLTMTGTDNGDGSITFTFELDVKSATGTGDFVKVMDGTLTHSGPATTDVDNAGGSTRVENKGTVNFDFTALSTVNPNERARGQISDSFDNVRDPAHGVKRSANITLTAFTPEEGDPHGPRTGSYSWEREPSVGGKFSFQDSVILFCPSNPSLLAADLTTVARWYRAADGVHGRSDSKATGGQIPAGNTWVGVTCANGQTQSSPAEGYWMMKQEDSTGATVTGQADTAGDAPCDAAFGVVPSVSNNATDYDFSAALTFPGEWQ